MTALRPVSTRLLGTLLGLGFAASAAAAPEPPAAAPPATHVTLEQIMADPDWMGNAPEEPYWSEDGRSVYYRHKQAGHEQRDLVRVDLATGANQTLTLAEEANAPVDGGSLSRDRRRKVYARDGNVFVTELPNGAVRQLTRLAKSAEDPQFLADDRRVSFRLDDDTYIVDPATGLVTQATDLLLKADPGDEEKDPAYLVAQQRRLFDSIAEQRKRAKEKRAYDRDRQLADPARPPLPWYLGEKIKIRSQSFSPSGGWVLLVTEPKDAKAKTRAKMPNYVTESGYVEDKEVRPLVGTGSPIAQSLLLLDLKERKAYALSLDELPGIKTDPLRDLREKAEAAHPAEKPKTEQAPTEAPETAAKDAKPKEAGEPPAPPHKDSKPATRAVVVAGIAWNEDGSRAAIELRSADNKDRWLVTLAPASHHLVSRHHLIDPAWVTWDFNDFGWLRDGETLFVLSEETGRSQLDLVSDRDGATHALTQSAGEVSAIEMSRDGRYLYYLTNATHPGIHEVWRVDVHSGANEAITHLGGQTSFSLSPDGKQLLLTHSKLAHPPELYLQAASPGATAKPVTTTTSTAFLAIPWAVPEIVPIPSTHVQSPIYARVYTPPATTGKRAAVVFVHGAGYLQEAHYGWSSYFHEFMFHTFLVEHGFVVLDMDYRASAGYGRDWRTAIYRNMGHPELEDLEDGVTWLAANRNVDPARVGVYGGSYGGFLTLMALFRRPELFAAGAALRPVTDWAHYNEFYSGAILNEPEIDPEAYATSSPIEFASGLAKPLLMCAGMQDDNVFFQDDVRLVQRLIELKKENFSIAPYPLEAHGFKAPIAWLDEYRRVWKLFEANLR